MTKLFEATGGVAEFLPFVKTPREASCVAEVSRGLLNLRGLDLLYFND